MTEAQSGTGYGYTCKETNTGAAPKHARSGATTMALWAACSRISKSDNTHPLWQTKYMNNPARPTKQANKVRLVGQDMAWQTGPARNLLFVFQFI